MNKSSKSAIYSRGLTWLLALALSALVAGCGGSGTDPSPGGGAIVASTKAITAFSLSGYTGTIDEPAKTIEVTLPSGTSVTALPASFSTTGASVNVGGVAQSSGSTLNNFSAPVAYTVTAADASTATYTVSASLSSVTAKALSGFSLGGVAGTVDEATKTVVVALPSGTNLTALPATFTGTGTGVKVGAVAQVSGTTTNDFSAPVTYTVTAADGSTATYTVSASVSAPSAKAVAGFSFAGYPGSAATINEAAKTIAVTVPSGTDVTALAANFSAAGASVTVGAVAQTSGTTTNDFSAPVAYTVTAADGTTATYSVSVSVGSSDAKAISAYSIAGFPAVAGTINEAAKTIAVTMPNGTDVTALVATFTTTGISVKVGAAVQTSTATANNFTAPVAYTVTAADGSTATYAVSITVAANSAKAVSAYSFAGFSDSVGTINEALTPKTIAVSVPPGTDLTALVATFTTTGASVKVGAAVQTSTATANNFSTSPLAYTVTAADGTTATYNVTVSLGSGPGPVLLRSAENFVILTKAGITDVPSSAITGNIGTSPISGAAIGVTCAEVTGIVYSVDAAGPACKVTNGTLLTTAVSDLETAYTDAAGRPAGVGPNLNVGAGTVAGQTLVPGTYTWGSNVTITTDLTLNGGANDVWIFQITGTLDMSPNMKVLLTGGAQPKNVFWQLAGVATLGAGSHFEGIILANTKIAMITGASIKGRLFAKTEVTLQQNPVTQP